MPVRLLCYRAKAGSVVAFPVWFFLQWRRWIRANDLGRSRGKDPLALLDSRVEMPRTRLDLAGRLHQDLHDALTACREKMLAGRVRRRAADNEQSLAQRDQTHLAVISHLLKAQAQVPCSASIGISVVNEPRTLHRRSSRLRCGYRKQPPAPGPLLELLVSVRSLRERELPQRRAWREDYHPFILGALAFAAAWFGRSARRNRWSAWERLHITGMGTSYIFLLTALYVDNGKSQPLWRDFPPIAYWVLPAAVGIPLILHALLWHPVVRATGRERAQPD